MLRKQAADILHKVYFGGGAVDDATAQVCCWCYSTVVCRMACYQQGIHEPSQAPDIILPGLHCLVNGVLQQLQQA